MIEHGVIGFMKGTSPWCYYLVRHIPLQDIMSKRRDQVLAKVLLYEYKDRIAHDSLQRRVKPHPKFSLPNETIERLTSRFTDRTPLRRPNCLSLKDLIIRDLRTPSPDPASLIPLPGLATMSLMLELRCESLVANKSCARGTLQVRELCIKAVRKAVRV